MFNIFVTMDDYSFYQVCANFVTFIYTLDIFYILPLRNNRASAVITNHVWNVDLKFESS